MGLWQVHTLFSKVFTSCNNLLLKVLQLLLALTKEILFAFLEAYLPVVLEIISL